MRWEMGGKDGKVERLLRCNSSWPSMLHAPAPTQGRLLREPISRSHFPTFCSRISISGATHNDVGELVLVLCCQQVVLDVAALNKTSVSILFSQSSCLSQVSSPIDPQPRSFRCLHAIVRDVTTAPRIFFSYHRVVPLPIPLHSTAVSAYRKIEPACLQIRVCRRNELVLDRRSIPTASCHTHSTTDLTLPCLAPPNHECFRRSTPFQTNLSHFPRT